MKRVDTASTVRDTARMTVTASHRFEVVPSAVLVGQYSVVDLDTRLLARSGRRIHMGLDHDDAIRTAARLEAAAARRRTCRNCRHRYPADQIEAGQCEGCRNV